MSKGTPSMGKRQKRVHIKCRRCGRFSLNIHTKVCVACGFKKTTRMRSYKWQRKSGLNGDWTLHCLIVLLTIKLSGEPCCVNPAELSVSHLMIGNRITLHYRFIMHYMPCSIGARNPQVLRFMMAKVPGPSKVWGLCLMFLRNITLATWKVLWASGM